MRQDIEKLRNENEEYKKQVLGGALNENLERDISNRISANNRQILEKEKQITAQIIEQGKRITAQIIAEQEKQITAQTIKQEKQITAQIIEQGKQRTLEMQQITAQIEEKIKRITLERQHNLELIKIRGKSAASTDSLLKFRRLKCFHLPLLALLLVSMISHNWLRFRSSTKGSP